MRWALRTTSNWEGNRRSLYLTCDCSDRACSQYHFSVVRLTLSFAFTTPVLNEIIFVSFIYFKTCRETCAESHSLKPREGFFAQSASLDDR